MPPDVNAAAIQSMAISNNDGPTSEMSDEFKKRAKVKLEASSSGIFFKKNDARLLPSFDRGEAERDEITLGDKLGEGAFCEVREIRGITLKRENNDADDNYAIGRRASTELSPTNMKEIDEGDFPVNMFQTKSDIRDYMSKVCLREDGEGEHARYALKQLKNESQKHIEQGLIDLSIEAQFLSCLNHPNIIKMRAVVGKSLSPDFGILLDRLFMTLEDKMDFWKEEKTNAMSGGFCGCLGFGSMDKTVRDTILFSAITMAYDLSCAMRYIHHKNLVYRDTKPENAGFDVRGDIKIFDFGFCKELHGHLLDKPSGLYKLTRMTGSYPYMAPENFLGKPYGRSSDVFSFGVLLWEMLHYKFAFYHFSKPDYKEVVIGKNYRPAIDGSLPCMIQTIIQECWDPDPKKRMKFDRIALLLKSEHQELAMDDSMIDRSRRMLDKSVRSFRTRNTR